MVERRPSGKVEWSIFVYIARNCRKVQDQELNGGEKISPRLVSFEELLMLSDDTNFCSHEVIDTLLRARIDPAKRAALKTKLGAV
jgi:hypothetical protein